jgi:hypothetical protein
MTTRHSIAATLLVAIPPPQSFLRHPRRLTGAEMEVP